MYQRRTFLDYVKRQEPFIEMAAIRRDERIQFGDDDQKYLSQFPPELNIWMRAIMYRYSPKVLQHPEQDEHTVPIVMQVENPDTGRLQQITKEFHVNVYPEELFKRLANQGYDVDKIDLSGNGSRTAARQAAEKELAFYKHTQDPSIDPEYVTSRAKPKDGVTPPKVIARGTFSMPDAKIEPFKLSPNWPSHWEDKDDPTKSRFIRAEKEFDHSPTIHEPIPLDDADKIFLKWFDENTVSYVDDDGSPLKGGASMEARPFKVRALMMRYNGQLLRDPQAQQKVGGELPGQIYKRIYFKNKGRRVVAENVPVHAQHLRKRLDKLKDQGVDFETTPIEFESANAWIKRGTYLPYKGQYGKGEQDKSIGNKKFKAITQYIDDQYKHLADEDFPSPGIHDSNPRLPNGRDFDYETRWESILDQESQVVAKRAVDIVSRQKAGSTIVQDKFPKDSNEGVNTELKTEIWTWLMKDDTVSKPNYKSQDWRIRAATAFAMEFIKRAVEGKGSASRSIDGDKDAMGDNLASIDKPVGGDDSALLTTVVDFLQQVQPEADLLPDDTDWLDVANRFMDLCHTFIYDQNNGRPLNKTQRMMVAKDLMRELVPAMAADKAPTAKIDPAVKQKHAHRHPAPEPETHSIDPSKGAVSYGGYDDNDEEDDPDEIERYRQSRFRR